MASGHRTQIKRERKITMDNLKSLSTQNLVKIIPKEVIIIPIIIIHIMNNCSVKLFFLMSIDTHIHKLY